MTESEILDRASEMLVEGGWSPGFFERTDGSHNYAGAMHIAFGNKSLRLGRYRDETIYRAFDYMNIAMFEKSGNTNLLYDSKHGGFGAAFLWEELPSRTLDEVLQCLKRASFLASFRSKLFSSPQS